MAAAPRQSRFRGAAAAAITLVVGLPILVGIPGAAHAVDPACWAVTDDTAELFVFHPDTANPRPPVALPLSQVFKGEGLAYRASTNAVALFSDQPSRLWYYDLDTAAETQVGVNLPGHVDGAAFFVDPTNPELEQLWVTIGANLYRLNPETAAVLSGPHPLAPIGGSTGGLGFEPTLGTLWATDDRPESALYSIDLTTYVATKVADIRFPDGLRPDAEGFDFAADGQMYTEEDQGDKRGTRYIYEVDPATGLITPAAGPVPGIGDVEGLACNGGANLFTPPNRPGLDIEKSVNGEDADVAPGPQLAEASVATFAYRVVNTGNVELFDLVVSDDRGVVVTCPSGDATIPTLAVGQSVECTGSATVAAGAYVNIGSVEGRTRPPTNPDGSQGEPVVVADTDSANLLGIEVVVVEPPTVPPTVPPTGAELVTIVEPPATTQPSVVPTRPVAPSTSGPDLTISLPPTGRTTAILVIAGALALLTGLTARRTARRTTSPTRP